MQIVDGLKIRNKIMVPLVALIVVTLSVLGGLSYTLTSTARQFHDLIYGPRLAARLAVILVTILALYIVGKKIVLPMTVLTGKTIRLSPGRRQFRAGRTGPHG